MKSFVHKILLVFLFFTLGQTVFASVDDSLINQYYSAGFANTQNEVQIIDNISHDIYRVVPVDTVKYPKNIVLALKRKVKTENRRIPYLDISKSYDLPISIGKTIAGKDYDLIISEMKFNKDGCYLTAFLVLNDPFSGKDIIFAGDNIRMGPTGMSGEGRLVLYRNVPLKMGPNITLNIIGENGKSYVEFDCFGYKAMGVEGDVIFSRDMLLPCNDSGEIITDINKKVKSHFEAELVGWSDLLVGVSIDKFQVQKLDGWIFSVQNAYLDMSDLANPPGIVFPSEYSNTTELWRGFSLGLLSVSIPRKFNSSSTKATTISATNMIIDNCGISGTFAADNIIPLKEGEAEGWSISLDHVQVELLKNQIKSAGLNGKMKIPLQKEEDEIAFDYSGFIDANGNILVNGALTSDVKIDVPVFSAKMTIEKGSNLELKTVDGKFRPKAVLNGKIDIDAGGNASIGVKGIDFQKLTLQTVVPYVDIEYFGVNVSSDSKFSKFPVSFKKIEFKKLGNQFGIGFGAKVNFSEKFSAEGSFEIISKIDFNENKINYQFDKIKINQLAIDVDQGAFRLKGELVIYNQDPVYGNGFKGMIELALEGSIKVAATAQFGTVRGMRYFYADALVGFSSGIPIFTGVGLYGFGGGIYYKMKRAGNCAALPTAGQMADNTTSAGASLSGVTYVPDSLTFLGVKATVIFGTYPKPDPFNGDATFEIAFNQNFGITYLGFTGNAYFMKKITDDSQGAKISAHLELSYVVATKTLSGLLEAYVNMPNLLVGTGPNNKAGTCLLYFSPSDWYIYIGQPTNRIGLKVINLLTLNSYFMVGTKIPAFPDPPAEITRMMGEQTTNFMAELNKLGDGSGIAFGASASISTGDKTFLIFYGNFSLGAGFDVMLKNYGSAHCVGENKPIGINGWYASGQAYAYVQGKIGIKVKVFGKNIKADILDFGAYALLQAKLPNPFYMEGRAGGYYNILGGLVSGKCDFKFTLGNECQIAGAGMLEGIQVISETTPADGSTDVNVFTSPQIAFNMEINKKFQIVAEGGATASYIIRLDYCRVKDKNGNEIQGNLVWNDAKNLVVFDSKEILPPKESMTFEGRIHFEEWYNNQWTPVSGDPGEEVKKTFTTGTAPDFIPEENVSFTYPVKNQLNFYVKEYNKGYISLDKGQEYLFNNVEGFKQVARFSTNGSNKELAFSYNKTESTLDFDIPSDLDKNKIYAFSIVNVPLKATSKVDENLTSATNSYINEGDNQTNLTTQDLEGNLEQLEEKLIYQIHFRSSQFATFIEKLNTIPSETGLAGYIIGDIDEVSIAYYGTELFDKAEISGAKGTTGLIKVTNLPDGWYNQCMKDLAYTNYPIAGNIMINYRDVNILGVPPFKDAAIVQNPDNAELSESDIQSNSARITASISYFRSLIGSSGFYDYSNLLSQCANSVLYKSHPDAVRIINGRYKGVLSGNYDMYLNAAYVLPGKDIVTSNKKITIFDY